MDKVIALKNLKDAIKKRNLFLMIALASMLLNLLLGFSLLLRQPNDRTILIPMGLKQTFWVDSHGISSAGLAEMTRYFATLQLNMTPEDSDYQVSQILKYTDPKTHNQLKSQLIKQADTLKREGLSTVFFPVNVTTHVKDLSAVITGDLSYFVGKQQTNSYRVSFLARYHYDAGRLYLVSFKEIEKHD